MPLSQVEILEKAKPLVSNLAAATVSVKKSAFLAVVADFMSDPNPDLKTLSRTLELLKQGSGGHLKRGGGFGDQVRAVVAELSRLLQEEKGMQPADYKSLFGWTARLLSVRQNSQSARSNDRRRDEPRPQQRSGPPGGRPQKSSRPPQPQASSKIPAMGGKNLDALMSLKAKLEKGEGEKK